jgi:hypothetical protein
MKKAACFPTHRFLAIAVLLVIAMGAMSSFAQSGAGSIHGTVTDPSGAVIPGASIHVVNKATGVAVDTKTNAVGFYQVPELFTGDYVVSVSAPGMKTSNQTIELLVAQDAVINAALTAGAVTQQVTVSANTVQLETTDNGAITSTLENARINELPMNGRNIITLVNEVTPGLENCPESSSCANGLEGPATVYEVDGASLENREFGGVHNGQGQMVDPDAIQEVRVEDEAGGAQYAAPATAIMSTKSGTNQLHGTAFWTTRNNAFGVARNRSNPSNYVAPEYIRNEAGASVGGPIVIPHLYHGKDRTFFFFAYERYSLAQAPFENQATPTAAMRNGDFSGLVSSSNVLQTLYDPYTTTGSGASTTRSSYTSENNMGTNNPNCASQTNCIPMSQENTLYRTFMAMTPLPTPALANVNPLVGANLDTQYFGLQVQPQITVRVDQVFNENNRAYLRYTHSNSSDLTDRNDPAQAYTLPATFGSTTIPKHVSGTEYEPVIVNAAALGYTHVFSPTFFAESVYNMTWYGENTWGGPVGNTDFESELGLPNNFGEPGFPIIEGSSTTQGNVADIFQPFDGTMFNYSVTYTDYTGEENLTKVLGKHQFLFGGRYMFEHLGSLPDRSHDSMEFDGLATGLLNASSYSASAANAASNTGNANADEFLGGAFEYEPYLQTPYEHLHDMETDAYFQDNWHPRSNLTVNLGLRWESHPAVWQGQGALMSFDIKNDALVTSGSLSQLESEGLTTPAIITNMQNDGVKFETPSQAGLPAMLVKSYNLNFLPRVGLAWQPFGKWGTVLRGGFGRYDYPVPVRESYREEDENDPFNVGYTANYTSNTYTPHANYILLSQPNNSPSFSYSTTNASTGAGFPLMGVNSANAVNSALTTAIPPGISIQNIDPDYPPDFVDEANFTIEQPIKWNSMLRVSYIYTHGTNLGNYWYYNNHPSLYSWEIQQDAIAPAASGTSIGNPQNSSTGEGPYDNLVYGGSMKQIQKTGWSNYNGLQVNYQKLYHSGAAWQVMYVWSKNLRTGGDYGGEGGDYVDPYINYVNSYVGGYTAAGAQAPTVEPVVGSHSTLPGVAPNLPPPPPTGTPVWGYYKALNRWENYMVDNNSPPQHLQFNGLLDLPFGRGKHWLSGVNKPLNELVGGWQIAGAGFVQFTYFYPATTNWGPTAASGPAANSLHVYKKNMPITDCRSGICKKAYEWFNGYIPPSNLSGSYTVNGVAGCAGTSATVVTGLATGWQPYQTPLDTYCTANGSSPSVDKVGSVTYYDTNDVSMVSVAGQKDGTVVGYGIVPGNNDNGSSESAIDVTNPFGHTALPGPWEWSADASLFKVFPITERFSVRMNVDAFNVLNHQGMANSSNQGAPSTSDGTICTTAGGVGCYSYNQARTLQLTLRVNF